MKYPRIFAILMIPAWGFATSDTVEDSLRTIPAGATDLVRPAPPAADIEVVYEIRDLVVCDWKPISYSTTPRKSGEFVPAERIKLTPLSIIIQNEE